MSNPERLQTRRRRRRRPLLRLPRRGFRFPAAAAPLGDGWRRRDDRPIAALGRPPRNDLRAREIQSREKTSLILCAYKSRVAGLLKRERERMRERRKKESFSCPLSPNRACYP